MRLALAAVLITVAAGSLAAQESKIARTDLPPAVEKAVAAMSVGATFKGFSKEVEKGKTYYEAEMMVNGHSKDASFDADGNLVELEEELAQSALPPAVLAGIKAKAGNGTLGKIESLTKQGKVVAYEAHVTTNGKRAEIQVGPDGKPLDHEE